MLIPALAALAALALAGAPAGPPIRIGLDLEFGHPSSSSAKAVELGARIAVDQVNAAGGVLGRPLELVPLDNRAVPARGVENVRTLAADPLVVALLCGKFSPVVFEQLPVVHELGLPLLSPWAAADGLIDHGRTPSWTFRLSLRDGWAMAALLDRARARGFQKVGLLLPNTSWGRSNAAAAAEWFRAHPLPDLVATRWFNLGTDSIQGDVEALREAGAQAVILVANENPAAQLVKEQAALPPAQRLPFLAHHGLAGGDFVAMAGPAVHEIDLEVVQIFTFVDAKRPATLGLLKELEKRGAAPDARHVISAAGIASAHDLVHLVARAVRKAGTTDRKQVRRALEELGPWEGAVRAYERPFTAERHEALSAADVFFARFDPGGALVRLKR